MLLTTVIDISTRRVVGWPTADHVRTPLIADALTNAVATRNLNPGVVFDSDRGCCQYTSAEFADLAGDLQITLSVGRTGQCWENSWSRSPDQPGMPGLIEASTRPRGSALALERPLAARVGLDDVSRPMCVGRPGCRGSGSTAGRSWPQGCC